MYLNHPLVLADTETSKMIPTSAVLLLLIFLQMGMNDAALPAGCVFVTTTGFSGAPAGFKEKLLSTKEEYCQRYCEYEIFDAKPCVAYIFVKAEIRCYLYSDVPTAGTGGGDVKITIVQCGNADCKYTAWEDTSTCPDCGENVEKTQQRKILAEATGTGQACDPNSLSQTVSCGLPTCPVLCNWSVWGAYSACPLCGTDATKTRERTIVSEGDPPCDPTQATETVSCGLTGCTDVDCALEWEEWGPCTGCTAGDGARRRSTKVVVVPQGNGAPCEHGVQIENCAEPICTDECTYSYSTWGVCTLSDTTICAGKQTRTATKTAGPDPCPNAPEEEQDCTHPDCPRNCQYTTPNWGDCSVACGGGQQTRTLQITAQPLGGGTACPNPQQSQPCNEQACDCTYTYNAFGGCTLETAADCSTGVKVRTVKETNGVEPCPNQPVLEEACTLPVCPRDCKEEFSPWSACSATCGTATRTRTNTVLESPLGGGTACVNAASETESCALASCPAVFTSAAQGINTVGSEYMMKDATTTDCQQLCLDTANCIAYAKEKDGVGNCYLYDKLNQKFQLYSASRYDLYVIVPQAGLTMTLCPFVPKSATSVTAKTSTNPIAPLESVCEAQCVAQSECIAYSFNGGAPKFSEKCRLYQTLDAAASIPVPSGHQLNVIECKDEVIA